MAGPSDPSRLTVAAARPEDDAGVRALLRRQVMEGTLRLTLEREPDGQHAAAVEGERHHMVVARRADNPEILGMASRAVRRVWWNGEPAFLGYLSQLRRVPELAGGRRLLRQGFEACNAARRNDELPFDLTSILADNTNARRLLERGLPGLPAYRPFCNFSTLTFGTRTSGRQRSQAVIEYGSEALLPAIVDCLERNLRRYQLAPVWSLADLRSAERTRGLKPTDFLVATEKSKVLGCLALWDQRSFKQVVVRGYDGILGPFRPWVNVGLTVVGRPRLPRPGRPLELAFLSHVAIDDDRPEILLDLVATARRTARRRGLDYLSMGFATDHPFTAAIQKATRARILESVLYLVGSGANTARLDSRRPHVEVAVL